MQRKAVVGISHQKLFIGSVFEEKEGHLNIFPITGYVKGKHPSFISNVY
jgi:hypothetical protein